MQVNFQPRLRVPLVWHLLIVFVATAVAVYVPLDLLFSITDRYDLWWMPWVVTVLFGVDIIVNLMMNREYGSVIQVEAEHRAQEYRSRWLIFDVIAALPLVSIFGIPWLGMFRLVKLVKVGYLYSWWRQGALRFASALLLIYIVYWMLLVTHWVSIGWIGVYGMDADTDWVTNYMSAVYWTVTTVTSVGYGDITPVTNGQRLYAVLVMLIGFGFFGTIIGSIAGLLSKKDPARVLYQERVEQLAVTSRYRHIPTDLQQRIFNYYTFVWRQRRGYDESDFLESLPPSLRREVSTSLKLETLDSIPLFHGAGDAFLRDIAAHLEPVIYTPGDWIFRSGEAGEEMYFIVRGDVEILDADESKILNTLSGGDFFGEIALFMDVPRTASVRATTFCDLYVLGRATHDAVVARYPDVVASIEAEARRRYGQGTYR